MGMANKEALARIPKNSILRDRVNDQQVILAKAVPEMIKNPKKRQNDEAGRETIIGG